MKHGALTATSSRLRARGRHSCCGIPLPHDPARLFLKPQIAVAATSRVDTGHTVYVGGTDYLTVGG